MPQPVRNGSTGATSAAGIGWAIQKKKVARAMTNSALGQCPWCSRRNALCTHGKAPSSAGDPPHALPVL